MLRQRLVYNQRGFLGVDRKSPIGAGWFFGAAALMLVSAASRLLAGRSRAYSAKLAGLRPVFG